MSKSLHKPEVLRRWRKDARLSQEALAQLAGLSRPSIARAELGEYVSLETLILLASALERNIGEVLTTEAQRKFGCLVPAT